MGGVFYVIARRTHQSGTCVEDFTLATHRFQCAQQGQGQKQERSRESRKIHDQTASLFENTVSFNIYLEVYITFGLFKDISSFYRLFSCFLLYLTFIFSLYINLKGVSKRNPNKNWENCCNPQKEVFMFFYILGRRDIWKELLTFPVFYFYYSVYWCYLQCFPGKPYP